MYVSNFNSHIKLSYLERISWQFHD